MTFIGKIRLRLFAFIIGAPLAVFGAVSLGPTWLALPVAGVAFIALSRTVNKTALRLAQRPACWTCGSDLSGRAVGAHGVDCPRCGTLNEPFGASAEVALESGASAGRGAPRA